MQFIVFYCQNQPLIKLANIGYWRPGQTSTARVPNCTVQKMNNLLECCWWKQDYKTMFSCLHFSQLQDAISLEIVFPKIGPRIKWKLLKSCIWRKHLKFSKYHFVETPRKFIIAKRYDKIILRLIIKARMQVSVYLPIFFIITLQVVHIASNICILFVLFLSLFSHITTDQLSRILTYKLASLKSTSGKHASAFPFDRTHLFRKQWMNGANLEISSSSCINAVRFSQIAACRQKIPTIN